MIFFGHLLLRTLPSSFVFFFVMHECYIPICYVSLVLTFIVFKVAWYPKMDLKVC